MKKSKQLCIDDLVRYCPACHGFFDKEGKLLKGKKTYNQPYKVWFDTKECLENYEHRLSIYRRWQRMIGNNG